MKPKTSDVWEYFSEIDTNYAKCNICDKQYSRKGRTTSSLKGHLKSMHKEQYEEFCKMEKQKEKLTSSAKKQMEDSIKKNQMWNTSHAKAQKIDDLIAEMIALQNLPFNFVEEMGFRRVIQEALPNYHLREGEFYTHRICKEICAKMEIKIIKMLKEFPKLSFTADVYENSTNISFLSLTARGITDDFNRRQFVLKCCRLRDSYSVDIICDHFKMMLLRWNVQDEQLHCFIRSGELSTATHLPHVPDMSCTVQQLQICVRSALDTQEVKNLFAKCTKILEHFKHSRIAGDEKNKTDVVDESIFHVIQDCVSRYHKTFDMIEQLLKIKDFMYLYASKHNNPQISPEECVYLNKILTIMTPFEEVIKNLNDTKTCISSVIPLIYVLKHTLIQEKDKFDTNAEFKIMIRKLIEEINGRFNDLPSNTLYSLATYLDPRYKSKFFNEIIKEQVQFELLRLLSHPDFRPGLDTVNATDEDVDSDDDASISKRIKIECDPLDDEPSTSFDVSPPTQTVFSIHSNLADILQNSDDEENKYSTVTNANSSLILWKRLIHDYNKENRLQLNEDPLLWWKCNSKYQVFWSIVRAYLSPPSSLVSIEHLFSGAGCGSIENHLEDENAEQILFVKYNLHVLNFEYR